MLETCFTCENEVICKPHACCKWPVCELCLKDGKCTVCYANSTDERPRRMLALRDLEFELERLLWLQKECIEFYSQTPKILKMLKRYFNADMKALEDMIDLTRVMLDRAKELPEGTRVLLPYFKFVRSCDFSTRRNHLNKWKLHINSGYVRTDDIDRIEKYELYKVPFMSSNSLYGNWINIIDKYEYSVKNIVTDNNISINEESIVNLRDETKLNKHDFIKVHDLYGVDINDEFRSLSNYPNLRNISLCESAILRFSGIKTIMTLPHIEKITIEYLTLTDIEDETITLSDSLRRLSITSQRTTKFRLNVTPRSRLTSLKLESLDMTQMDLSPLKYMKYVTLTTCDIDITKLPATIKNLSIFDARVLVTTYLRIKHLAFRNSFISDLTYLIDRSYTNYVYVGGNNFTEALDLSNYAAQFISLQKMKVKLNLKSLKNIRTLKLIKCKVELEKNSYSLLLSRLTIINTDLHNKSIYLPMLRTIALTNINLTMFTIPKIIKNVKLRTQDIEDKDIELLRQLKNARIYIEPSKKMNVNVLSLLNMNKSKSTIIKNRDETSK
jgi:hypothetical protein